MDQFKKVIFSKAFDIIPGPEYNRFAFDLREKSGGAIFMYEIVMKDDHSWEHLKEKAYPNLVRFMTYKRIDPEGGERCVVALFFRGFFYCMWSADFIQAFREIEGLSPAGFRAQARKWISVPLEYAPAAGTEK
ncbi:MAG: STAUR_1299 family protein [Syntrophales bacterium]